MIRTTAATTPTPTSQAQTRNAPRAGWKPSWCRGAGAPGRGPRGLGVRGFLFATKNRIRTVADASLRKGGL